MTHPLIFLSHSFQFMTGASFAIYSFPFSAMARVKYIPSPRLRRTKSDNNSKPTTPTNRATTRTQTEQQLSNLPVQPPPKPPPLVLSIPPALPLATPKRRGRPPGSKNKVRYHLTPSRRRVDAIMARNEPTAREKATNAAAEKIFTLWGIWPTELPHMPRSFSVKLMALLRELAGQKGREEAEVLLESVLSERLSKAGAKPMMNAKYLVPEDVEKVLDTLQVSRFPWAQKQSGVAETNIYCVAEPRSEAPESERW